MKWLRVKKWLLSMRRERKRQLKQNFSGTESKILVDAMTTLGKPFERLPTMFVKDCGFIPVVLTNAAFVIEKNIKTKSVFQAQGNVSKINASLSRLSAPRLTKIKHENVHDVVETMKAFLVHLPEPLLPESTYDALITASRGEDTVNQYVAILTRFRNSSPQTFAILHFMMLLLRRISEFSEYNCMDVRKLATVFVLDIIKPLKLEESNEGFFLIERMQRLPYLIMVIENIINRVDIFKTVNHSRIMARSPRDLLNLSTADQHNNSTLLVSNSRQGSINHDNNANKGDGENVSQTAELIPRALSEPQKEQLCSLKICKRCSTAVPVCTSDAVSKISDTPEAISRDTPDWVFSRKTTPNPIEISLEIKADRLSVPTTSTDEYNEGQEVVNKSSAAEGKTLPDGGCTFAPLSRASGKKEPDYPAQNTTDIKIHKIVDIRIANSHRKKRKLRSGGKKSKHELENSTAENSCRGSDFATFKPDEEITPWKEASSNSDDTSVMVKTIRNPRILVYSTGTPITPKVQRSRTEAPKSNRIFISPEVIPRVLLTGSRFRTISRQKNVTVVSESSESPNSSGESYCVKKPRSQTSDDCVQLSSHENTPISKELIRGVKLKGSVGVNTSPYPRSPLVHTKKEDAQKFSEKCSEVPKSMIRLPQPKEKRISPRLLSSTSGRNTHMTESEGCSNGQRCLSAALPNNTQEQSLKTSVANDMIPPSGKVSRPGSHVRFRHNQLRRAPSSCAHLQKMGNKWANVQPHDISIGEWFIDIVLVCITIFCISLVFVFHEYNKP